jgi:hypothetical protein
MQSSVVDNYLAQASGYYIIVSGLLPYYHTTVRGYVEEVAARGQLAGRLGQVLECERCLHLAGIPE